MSPVRRACVCASVGLAALCLLDLWMEDADSMSRKKPKKTVVVTRSKTVTRSNPQGGYLGNTRAVVYQRFPGHKCSAACKRAGHLYIHKFPPKERTPLRFARNRKKLTIG